MWGIITISYSDVVTPGCGNSYTVVRTWEAEDECGNVSSCDQNITVRDITAPTISCPGDRTLDCPADTMPSNTGMASATDACGGIITISYSDVVTPGCGNSYTVVRTWEAEDECGNVSSCDQNITVRDITAPTISCPGRPDVGLSGGHDAEQYGHGECNRCVWRHNHDQLQ